MGRSTLFGDFNRAIRMSLHCKKNHISTNQGMEQLAEIKALKTQWLVNRHEKNSAKVALGKVGAVTKQLERADSNFKKGADVKIGIVGGGLAGLACAYELKQHGIFATIYEANDRVGGRCFSLGGAFPGSVSFPNQVVERGGEFIDSKHQALLRLVKQFGLILEDVSQQPGEIAYFFNGKRYEEAIIVDEYRNFLAAIDADLRRVSPAPTADNYTDTDVYFDNISLLEYLETRNVGDFIKAAISATYMAEYGLELEEQSCLNLLMVVRELETEATPFHIFSDECYHVVGGNEQIVQGLSNELHGQINLGMRLVKACKNSANRIALTFNNGSQTTSVEYDAVVLAIPFPVLRQIELDASLELPGWKLEAIDKLDNGTHAKMMLGFQRRPWVNFDSHGISYSDMPNHQTTWESNPTQATDTHAVLVDYSSGKRGAKLNPHRVQAEAKLFLADLDKIYPGAIASAVRDLNGDLLVHLEHWLSNPLAQGSYACYKPGQFTTIAGNEAKSIDNLFFAGEQANSFYEWQGYMEGAVLSGITAAQETIQYLKLKALPY